MWLHIAPSWDQPNIKCNLILNSQKCRKYNFPIKMSLINFIRNGFQNLIIHNFDYQTFNYNKKNNLQQNTESNNNDAENVGSICMINNNNNHRQHQNTGLVPTRPNNLFNGLQARNHSPANRPTSLLLAVRWHFFVKNFRKKLR